MPLGKKLAVVLSVVVVGVSVAMCFSKDSSPLAFWRRGADDPFGTHVERRVGGALPIERIPAPATAAITQPDAAVLQAPAFHQTYRPVGTLLAPIDNVSEPVSEPRPAPPMQASPPGRLAYGGVTRHTVEDGDTLSKLALRYLGRTEAYLQIYEANRDVLASPDLLPIGAVLTIPSPGGSFAAPARGEETGLPMVPVPGRPQPRQ